MHSPINHPLRPLYRILAALAGLYVLLFGLVGLVEARGSQWFEQGDTTALGLRTNLAFAGLSVAAGVIILAGAAIGRNVDTSVNMAGAVLFLVIGTVMMLVMHTDANVLNFSIRTCIVSYVIGLVLLTASLYGKVGSTEAARAEEAFRHG